MDEVRKRPYRRSKNEGGAGNDRGCALGESTEVVRVAVVVGLRRPWDPVKRMASKGDMEHPIAVTIGIRPSHTCRTPRDQHDPYKASDRDCHRAPRPSAGRLLRGRCCLAPAHDPAPYVTVWTMSFRHTRCVRSGRSQRRLLRAAVHLLRCDRESTYRESIPIEIAGLLFHNDQCWLRWSNGGTPGLT
jgi:hypothetical protein